MQFWLTITNKYRYFLYNILKQFVIVKNTEDEPDLYIEVDCGIPSNECYLG